MQRLWYEEHPPPWWTLPLAALYAGVCGLRRVSYRRGWLKRVRLPVPVIVVGNITVGGAGKTPLVIALVEALRARGFKPGVVGRGYGGTPRAPPLLGPDPHPLPGGEEPALIRQGACVPAAIGADRPGAARLLVEHGVDVVIADDGLQHYALARDIEVCVVDGARGFGNERLLPAGPLREPLNRLREADFVVRNGGDPLAGEIPMRLEPCEAVSLADPSRRKPLADFVGTRVNAVAGIGDPQRFFDALRGRGVEVTERPFPDHHRYSARDLDFDDGLPVLMTEKDAVKCRGFAAPDWWSVPVSAELPMAFFDALASRLKSTSPGA